MHKYEIILYWSKDDEAFVAEVPELPGCAAHGPTQHEALVNANDAIQLWLDTAREHNDPIPNPKATASCLREARHSRKSLMSP